MSFHLYRINELYSNADGSVQFIEMAVGPFDGESFWQGQTIRVTQGSTSHSYIFPSDLPSESTANTTVLIATQGFANLGIVAPDFIVPSGFLFINGGTVNFANADTVSYSPLPTDGTHSVDRNGITQVDSPRDFAGATGTVIVPGNAGQSYTGTAADDILVGGTGNDNLTGGLGNDLLDGGAGIDTAHFNGLRASYTINGGAGTISGPDGADSFTNIERLQFADTKLAIDLDGNAGTTAKILGAVFGAASLSNKQYVGIGLSYLDGGMSYQDLIMLALNARLGAGFSNTAEVNLLYQNLVGVLPSADNLDYWVGELTAGQFSQASLAVMAADLDLNKTNINLVGLAQTGIEFTP